MNMINIDLPRVLMKALQKRRSQLASLKHQFFCHTTTPPGELISNNQQYPSSLSISDEPELEFSGSSRAKKVPSRAELGHLNFRAETELKFF